MCKGAFKMCMKRKYMMSVQNTLWHHNFLCEPFCWFRMSQLQIKMDI